jgi:branched-chain amino acid transport system substrate-binding protein
MVVIPNLNKIFGEKMRNFKLSIALLSGLLLVFSSLAFAKVEGDTITLGAAVSLTGKYSTNGKNTKNGYELAIKRINEMGGVKVGGKSYKFKIVYYDDESNGGRAAQLAERLIKQDGIKYMLGPYSSGITKAIAPVTEENKIPMVEANGASRSLFTKGYKYLFAVLSAANQYLEVAIDLAVERNGGKGVRIAMAFEQDAFSQDVKIGVVEAAKRTGSEIVIDDNLPKELNDMAATLAKVKALKPDVLVVSGHTKGALTAIRQLADMRVNVPMLAMTHCDAGKLSKQHGEKAEYALCAAQWHKSLTYKDNFFGNGMDYDRDYTAEYGSPPPYQSAESSAALLVWKDAFERANSFDTEKVRDALAKTNMQTFYGNIKFSDTGQNIAKPMVLFQVRCDGGKCTNKVVAPTKWASTKIVHPIPSWSQR